MASLKDASKLVKRLEERSKELREQLGESEADFGRLSSLADDIGAEADSLAAVFGEMDQAVSRLVDGAKPGRGDESLTEALSAQRSRAKGDSDEEPTKAELLEQAKKADISGRSAMSKEELEKALRSQEA